MAPMIAYRNSYNNWSALTKLSAKIALRKKTKTVFTTCQKLDQ